MADYSARDPFRLIDLLAIPRCVGGNERGNFVSGLVELICEAQPKSVLEIGCDQGVSTECFLLFADRVVAVDTWEHTWAEHEPIFRANCGKYPNLEVIKEASPGALSRFADKEFDLVYIDADHDDASVTRDIFAAKRIAKRWLAGHDYDDWCAVKQVVPRLLGEPKVFSDTSWLIDLNAS